MNIVVGESDANGRFRRTGAIGAWRRNGHGSADGPQIHAVISTQIDLSGLNSGAVVDARPGARIHVGVTDNTVASNAFTLTRRRCHHVHQLRGARVNIQIRSSYERTIANTRDGTAGKFCPAN